jgi:hypothetical protein
LRCCRAAVRFQTLLFAAAQGRIQFQTGAARMNGYAKTQYFVPAAANLMSLTLRL